MVVKIIDFADEITNIVPAAHVYESAPRNGIVVAYELRFHFNERLAVDENHAREILRRSAEEVRIMAIRDLGLRPIMDAYEKNAERSREALYISKEENKRLRDEVARLTSMFEEFEERVED